MSILSEPDLELLSNLEPSTVADVINKEFVEHLKQASSRILDEKREAFDTIEFVKLIGRHQGKPPTEHRPFSPSSSTTSLSTMSSFSSNNQQ